MAREGHQHGMARTHRILPSQRNPRSESHFVQQFNSFPTVGLFTKVSKKPTDHSKFTGRCGNSRCLGCHMHPACKAKKKTKGSHKLRSSDITTNYRLITWRVIDGRPGLNFSGFSAASILDHLSNDYDDHDDDDNDDDFKVNSQFVKEIENDERKNTQENIDHNYINDHDDDNDDGDEKDESVNVDDDVKFVLNQDLEEEDWCLVGEINDQFLKFHFFY